MKEGGLQTKGIMKCSSEESILITVVTVVYNGAQDIEKTIQSVISQTYNNIQYIIIDGNSNDNTLDFVKKHENKIDIWISESDNGIYDAMNKAIDLANGEYICFMNSGDLFANNDVIMDVFSDKLVKNFDVIYGNVINRWNFGDQEKKTSDKTEMPFCHQSAFTSTKLLKKYHFDVSYRICADRFFYKTINDMENASYLYIDMPISIFQCENSISVERNVERYKEISHIRNYGKIKYLKGLIKIRIKDFIIKFFPKLVLLYRKTKVIK